MYQRLIPPTVKQGQEDFPPVSLKMSPQFETTQTAPTLGQVGAI